MVWRARGTATRAAPTTRTSHVEEISGNEVQISGSRLEISGNVVEIIGNVVEIDQ